MKKTYGISLSWIVVKDIEAAIKFYTDTVGLTLREFCPDYGWAELQGPEGTCLGIAKENKEQDAIAGTNAVVTVRVDCIKKARQEFEERGVRLLGGIIEIPGHVSMQTFQDSDGNTMQLVEVLDDTK